MISILNFDNFFAVTRSCTAYYLNNISNLKVDTLSILTSNDVSMHIFCKYLKIKFRSKFVYKSGKKYKRGRGKPVLILQNHVKTFRGDLVYHFH